MNKHASLGTHVRVTCDRLFLNTDYSKANIYEGPVTDYLGMLFYFSLPGELGNMVAEFLQELPVADDAHAESPAASHLYIIDESEVMLDDTTSKHLHSSVAKAFCMTEGQARYTNPNGRES